MYSFYEWGKYSRHRRQVDSWIYGKTDIAAIKRRIETIDAERVELIRRLDALERNRSGGLSPLSPEEKIEIFRGLFRGREDVYPKGWVSDRTGRSGYNPVCANEWRRGVCEKPRIKCTDCPNQAFVTIPVPLPRPRLPGVRR